MRDNFCYLKVGRAITKCGAIEKKSNIAFAILKNYHFQKVPKIISNFDGSNTIFADCMLPDCCQI